METFWQDLRYGLRRLKASPVFTVIVIFTLTLGIGANTAIFSVINALLLTPLPYKEPDRLVRVMSQRGNEVGMLSLLEVYDLKEAATVFEDFATFRNTQYNVTGDGPPESLTAAVVTYNLFDLLGTKPLIGATWPQSHEKQRVFNIVLSYSAWQRRFGADPNIVGKKILLDTAEYEVLAVMPKGFNFPTNIDLYRRVPPGDFDSRAIRESAVIARLKPGVTIEQAQAELDSLAQHLEGLYPNTNTNLRLQVKPFREQYVGRAAAYLWLLLGAVGFVLLIACVNVVNLMLARALTREKETALRVALGASRGRLIRQTLTESLLLTLSGGLLGLGLAYFSTFVMTDLVRLELPPWMKLTIDANVLVFTLIISIAVGLLAGLIPALQASKPNLNDALKDTAKGSSGSAAGHRIRRSLVVAQVALALALLVGAGLMVNSFLRLQEVALGFDSGNLLTMKMDPPWAKYQEVAKVAPFYKRVIEEIHRIPGVESAAFNDSLPLAGQDIQEGTNKLSIQIEGQSISEQESNAFVNAQIISFDYFRTMKMHLTGGRPFDDRDQESSQPVAIISQRFAESFWKGQDPLGKRLRLGKRSQNFRPVLGGHQSDEPWLTVIGIVNNVRQRGVLSEAGLDVYLCDQQIYSPESFLAVRGTVEPMTLVQAVKQAVWRIDPEQSMFDIQTMERRVTNTIWQQRLAGIVMLMFAGLALVLAAVGIYGVMSYLVSRRTREIGIRLALGARASDVLKMVIGEAMKLMMIGGAIGLVASLALTRIIANLLFGISASDPLTFIGVTLLLTGVALVACFVPAYRASRTDPMIGLRYE
jgi:putative ABC transport system permease protein